MTLKLKINMNFNDYETSISKLKLKVEQFMEERKWRRFHQPKNLAESICIESAELMELFQWMGNDESYRWAVKPGNRVKVEEELADILIYILSLANILKIDLTSATLRKLEKDREKYPIDEI